MKKILAILLVAVLSVALFTACSGEPAAEGSASASTEASAEASTEASAETGGEASSDGNYTIAVVPKDSTNPWFVRMEEGVKKYQEENPGMTVFQRGPAETDAAQ